MNGDTFDIAMAEDQTVAEEMRYVGFWVRFWAYLADLLVIFAISTLLLGPVNLLFELNQISIGFWTVGGILGVVIFYGYFLLMTRLFGQTLGKMIFGLRVVHINGEQLTWGDLFFREVVGRFINEVLFHIVYIVVAFTPQKEGVHDMVGNTRVVYEKSR
ncbi:RDD family protein [Lentibacillus saliphilus]|uniref:RDD family protein n=1 Tax=Lentibacillus saliphilus TaxID=2737028 RepID=UPI001FE4CCD4|nr:RDD family protein [Lentibacillus saliphilus]